MLRQIAAGFFAATLLSTAAKAVDLPMDEGAPIVAPAAMTDWTGFYLGLQAGYGMETTNHSEYDSGDDFSYENGSQGFQGGIFAGYNFQFGSVVAGVEAEANVSNIEGEEDNRGTFYSYEHDLSVAARARLGFLPADNVLLYASMGWAMGRFDHSEYYTGAELEYENARFKADGLQAGLGIEGKLTQHISIRAEGIYTNYGDERITYPGVDPEDYHADVDADTFVGRAGVAFSF